MEAERHVVQADGRGRILLPKPLRERLGIAPGAAVDVEAAADGSVVLRDVRQARLHVIQAARGSMRGRGSSVDELIAERRAEAAREAND